MGNKNSNTQPKPQAQIGRHVRALPILTKEDKIRVQVAARAKADERVRAVEGENARLRRDHAFDELDRVNREILDLRTIPYSLTPTEKTRQQHVLDGALSRHKSKGFAPKDFRPHEILDADLVRHGRAQRPPAADVNPLDAQLPPVRQEGRVLPNDASARDAAMKASQERGARQREQVMNDRAAYSLRLRELGLADPSYGSTPGDARGGFGS